ncbi:MAG: class I SAM-dependent methyltransferase [Clostridia bacterium]|nr:class I SAM-dependent methyltransferase [Clostridia bacterium]
MSGRSCYDALSPVYDRFNGDVDYGAIAGTIGSLFKKFSKKKIKSVLDLGCGTGPLTERLALDGYAVTGLDISSDMLALASAREGCVDRGVQFVVGDMRNFKLPERVGAVVSTQDTVSHLLTPQSLRRCFSCVAGALSPGGIFVFDVNTAYKMREIYGDNTFVLEDEDSFTVWENEYLPAGPGVEFRVTVFTGTASGLWERDEGVTRERGWSPRSVANALREAGLEPVFTASAWDLGTVGDETERIVFAAIKK